MNKTLRAIIRVLALCLLLLMLASCEAGEKECVCDCNCGDEADDDTADDDDGDDDDLDSLVCDAQSAAFSTTITNPYVAFEVGNQWNLEGMEDFQEVRERITVLDQTDTVGSVTARVVESRKWADNELIEISLRYYGQSTDGTVCYFGKDVDEYRYGSVTGHDGSWRAGEDGAASGIFMPGDPEVGMTFEHFNAPGIASESSEITAMDGTYTTPAGSFSQVLTMKSTTLDGGRLDRKFAYDYGMIVEDAKELAE